MSEDVSLHLKWLLDCLELSLAIIRNYDGEYIRLLSYLMYYPFDYYHHHQPINVSTAERQSFFLNGKHNISPYHNNKNVV
jgi:hypothetical protein